MLSITDTINAMTPVDRTKILIWFNSGESGYIEYEPKKVLGVNTPAEEVTITQQQGFWYFGELK